MVEFVFVLLPNSPIELSPHDQSVPSFLIAWECNCAALQVFQLLALPTCWGTKLLFIVPFPKAPEEFVPHDHSVPSVLKPIVWNNPVSTADHPLAVPI